MNITSHVSFSIWDHKYSAVDNCHYIIISLDDFSVSFYLYISVSVLHTARSLGGAFFTRNVVSDILLCLQYSWVNEDGQTNKSNNKPRQMCCQVKKADNRLQQNSLLGFSQSVIHGLIVFMFKNAFHKFPLSSNSSVGVGLVFFNQSSSPSVQLRWPQYSVFYWSCGCNELTFLLLLLFIYLFFSVPPTINQNVIG